jgi:hypothetical protein
MGDFEFDTELLISLVATMPVLRDKTYDNYKDRIEKKKTWTKVCICSQEDFVAPGNVKKRCW